MITEREIFNKGRLTARPKEPVSEAAKKPGMHSLALDPIRDGFIYVPEGYKNNAPASLAVMLHGAGADAIHGLNLLKQQADDHHIILLAPASRAATWDIIVKDFFAADVVFIDQAISQVFEHFNIDPQRIAIGDFSDGASYALCLGLTNGDLFTHIIAFSPGFYHTMENTGKPNLFVSHGMHDSVLPIAPCSRRIVARLKRSGYNVQYEEFEGEHEIPKTISDEVVDWFFSK